MPLSAVRRTVAAARSRLARPLRQLGGNDLPDDPSLLLDGTFLRQLEALSFAAPHAATAGLAGEHASRRKAHSVEFSDHRNYAPGDDFRLIDWNVYARLGELCLKLTEARENIAVHLLIDLSASMDWGRPNKLLYAKRVAAALGALALANYDTVYLGAFSDQVQTTFPPLRGRAAVGALVDHLRSLTPATTTDLAHAASQYCNQPGRRGIAVLLSDFLVAEGHAEALGYLARSGLQTTVLHIVDATEEAPQFDGLLELHDRETGELVKVGVTPQILRRYATHYQQWADELQTACRSQRARYVRVPTAVPPQSLIMYTLRRDGILR